MHSRSCGIALGRRNDEAELRSPGPVVTAAEPARKGDVMPRYFFNLHLEGEVVPDLEGQEFRDADEAWEATLAMAQNLMQTEFSRPINWTLCHFEVTDETGDIVHEFPFVEAIKLSQPMH
jgi:hypothetical protein